MCKPLEQEEVGHRIVLEEVVNVIALKEVIKTVIPKEVGYIIVFKMSVRSSYTSLPSRLLLQDSHQDYPSQAHSQYFRLEVSRVSRQTQRTSRSPTYSSLPDVKHKSH